MMFLSCKKLYLTTIAFSWVFIVLGAGKDSDPILHREKRCKYTMIYNTINGNGIIGYVTIQICINIEKVFLLCSFFDFQHCTIQEQRVLWGIFIQV